MTAMIQANDPDGYRDVFGPLVKFVTKVPESGEDYCVAHSIFPSSAIVPVHSHPDRETFYVISGELELWDGQAWTPIRAGEFADVPPNHIHAWQNRSGSDATVVFVTTGTLGRFFKEVMAQPIPKLGERPSPALMTSLAEIAARYDYWMGGSADNTAAGFGQPS